LEAFTMTLVRVLGRKLRVKVSPAVLPASWVGLVP